MTPLPTKENVYFPLSDFAVSAAGFPMQNAPDPVALAVIVFESAVRIRETGQVASSTDGYLVNGSVGTPISVAFAGGSKYLKQINVASADGNPVKGWGNYYTRNA